MLKRMIKSTTQKLIELLSSFKFQCSCCGWHNTRTTSSGIPKHYRKQKVILDHLVHKRMLHSGTVRVSGGNTREVHQTTGQKLYDILTTAAHSGPHQSHTINNKDKEADTALSGTYQSTPWFSFHYHTKTIAFVSENKHLQDPEVIPQEELQEGLILSTALRVQPVNTSTPGILNLVYMDFNRYAKKKPHSDPSSFHHHYLGCTCVKRSL